MIGDRFVDVSYNAPTADSRPTATVELHVVDSRIVTVARTQMQFTHRLPRQTYFLSVSILLLVFHPSCADRFMCAELSFPVLTRQRLETGTCGSFHGQSGPYSCLITETGTQRYVHRQCGRPEARSSIRTVPILLNSPCTGSRVVSR